MKKVLKWSLILGGGFIALLIIVGLIGRATMSPEELAAIDSAAAAKAAAVKVDNTESTTIDAKAETVAETTEPANTGGFGKDRDFFKAKFGTVFSWSEAPLNDGRDRLLGQSDNGLGTVELIGPEDNLTQVTMMVGVTEENQKGMGTVLGDLALTIEPESVSWIAEHVEGGGETTVNGTRISVHRLEVKGGSMVTLAFERE
jgi:hypothetical protein